MKFFRDLKLRTKLILSFVIIALLVSMLAFAIPQFSVDRLTEQSVPFLDLTGQTAVAGSTVQREVLEYLNSAEAESIEEFVESSETMHAGVAGIKENFGVLVGKDTITRLEWIDTEVASTGQAIFASHNQTLGNMAQLEEAENTLETMHKEEHTLKTGEGRELLHTISDNAKGLQLEAIKFVTSGEEDTVAKFLEHEADFKKLRETAIPALLAAEPEAVDFVTAFDQVSGRMAELSRAIIDSHSETLAGTENLEILEEALADETAALAVVAAQEIQSSETQLRTNFLITSGLLTLLAIGFGIVITRGIVKPVQQLAMTARQLGAGDLSVRAEVSSQDEIGRLAQVFNQMATQMQEAFTLVEQQSMRRIQQLEITADISRQLTTMLEVDKLLQYVVSQVQQSFNYYHVHIYLVDPSTDELVMREGSGDVGRQLKARGHRLQPGQGIVGQVAGSGQPMLVSNVDDIPDFVRNPLLPKTRAELAVPLRKGSVVLGVLDTQSEELEGFTDEDLTLLQSIADQIAVAIDNARLFRALRAAASEAEALNRRLTLAAWADLGEKTSASGYVFTKSGATPVASATPAGDEEWWLPSMSEAIKKKEMVYQGSETGNGHNRPHCLSVPLMLRDQVIGVIGIERSVPAAAAVGDEQKSSRVSWTDDEITTVQQISEQVTLALDAARLSNETRRAAWRDRVVSESTAQVWAHDEIEEVMRAAVAQLGSQLQASEVVIRLGKENDLLAE